MFLFYLFLKIPLTDGFLKASLLKFDCSSLFDLKRCRYLWVRFLIAVKWLWDLSPTSPMRSDPQVLFRFFKCLLSQPTELGPEDVAGHGFLIGKGDIEIWRNDTSVI